LKRQGRCFGSLLSGYHSREKGKYKGLAAIYHESFEKGEWIYEFLRIAERHVF